MITRKRLILRLIRSKSYNRRSIRIRQRRLQSLAVIFLNFWMMDVLIRLRKLLTNPY